MTRKYPLEIVLCHTGHAELVDGEALVLRGAMIVHPVGPGRGLSV